MQVNTQAQPLQSAAEMPRFSYIIRACMEPTERPTIKGIFVKSHIRALERERGVEGVRELTERIGHPINYLNTDDVMISEEVQILEHIVDMLSAEPLTKEEREREAGRLHFRNFSTTPLWHIIDPLVGSNLKFVLLQSSRIAGYVFQGVQFTSEDIGPKKVRITLFNNDYPINHFRGFFEEMLRYFELVGSVDAAGLTRGRFEYTISWQ